MTTGAAVHRRGTAPRGPSDDPTDGNVGERPSDDNVTEEPSTDGNATSVMPDTDADADGTTVQVRTNWEPKRLVLEVADDGPGIPESERGPILGGDDITQLHHGTGLGLWLARCTVEVCDGTLEYERTDDGWTIVRLGLRPV